MPSSPARPARTARWVASVLCAVLAAAALTVAGVGWWLRGTVLDTPTWVTTVAPLASNADVQGAVAAYASDQVLLLADSVSAASAGGRAPSVAVAGFLSGPGRSLVRSAVDAYVRSGDFARLWRDTNRTVHPQVLALLDGRLSDGVQQRRGQVVADLTPLMAAVLVQVVDSQPVLRGVVPVDPLRGELTPAEARARLSQLVGAPLPSGFAVVAIADTATLPELRTAANVLSDGVVPVGLVAVGLAVAAVVLAPRRGIGLVVVGLSVAVCGLVALLAAGLLEGTVVDQVSDPTPRAAAEATARVVTRRLAPTLEVLMAAGLVAAGAGVAVALVAASARSRPARP